MGVFDRFFVSAEDRFARELVAELHRNGIPVATYSKERFAVTFATAPDDDGGGEIFLHNVFAETRSMGRQERRDRIRQLVLGVARGPKRPEGWDAVRPTLRPVLRATFFGRVDTAGMKPLLSRPALPHLNEYVVIDLPTTMSYVTLDDLAKWGVSADEVFGEARENLAARTGRAEPVNGILAFVDPTGDDYLPSRLLLDGWLAGLAPEGAGVVAFASERGSLLVMPDAPDAVAAMFAAIESEYRESPRSVSTQAYTTDASGRVVPYLGPVGHPVREAARRADLIMSADEYAAQAKLLSAEYEADGVDVYVGSVILAKPKDGPLYSVTTWAQGIESLLPRAEYLAFVDSGQSPVQVRWEDVEAELPLLPEPGIAPLRFRVGHWPPAEVMDRLRAKGR